MIDECRIELFILFLFLLYCIYIILVSNTRAFGETVSGKTAAETVGDISAISVSVISVISVTTSRDGRIASQCVLKTASACGVSNHRTVFTCITTSSQLCICSGWTIVCARSENH